MKKIYLLLFGILITLANIKGQDKRAVDSLLNVLKTSKEDTTKVHTLRRLAKAQPNDTTKALDYVQQSLALSQKLEFKEGIANAYATLGDIASDKADYSSALNYYIQSLRIRETLGNKRDIAVAYNNLGWVYYYLGNNAEAIKNDYAALKHYEELGDKKRVARMSVNIALIQFDEHNYTEALKIFKNAYDIFKVRGDKFEIATCYSNMGMVYDELYQFDEAIKNYKQALEIQRELNDKASIALIYNNLGNTLQHKGDNDAALKYLLEGQNVAKEIQHAQYLASIATNLGEVYTHKKNYPAAYKILNEALDLAQKNGYLETFRVAYQSLATLDSLTGHYKQAFNHIKLSTFYRDSLYNTENSKKILKEQAKYDYDKKEAALKYEKELTAEQLKEQKTLTTALFIGLIALLLAAALWYQWQKQKQLQKAAAIQAEFTQRLLQTTEDERGRIAIDLHDSISHELLSLKRGIKPNPEVSGEGVHEKIDRIIDDIRQISRNLHPVLLDKIGLKLSIETLCEQYGEHETLFVSHDINYEKPLPKPAELQVFRIIQEALNNTVKYAQANASNITMTQNTEGALLEIKDNGKGFDVQKALDSGKSFGLHSIIQRSKAIGGKAKIQSSEQGTIIKITIPSPTPKGVSITNN